MNEQLIIVRQLPAIEEHLRLFKDAVMTACEHATSLAVTEDTLTSVKAKRAELSKMFKELEDKRKDVKRQILAPYEEFEAVYKDCVSDAFRQTDALLKSRIDEVENGLKEQKAARIKRYHDEYCAAAGIDFVSFERIVPVVNRSISDKKLKETIKEAIDNVVADIATIDTFENADEIRAEYKKSLSLSTAISVIAERHRAIEAEREKAEAVKAEAEVRAAAVARVEETLAAQEETLSAPVEEDIHAQDKEAEVIYEVTFTVYGTRAQITELKKYLIERGLTNG